MISCGIRDRKDGIQGGIKNFLARPTLGEDGVENTLFAIPDVDVERIGVHNPIDPPCLVFCLAVMRQVEVRLAVFAGQVPDCRHQEVVGEVVAEVINGCVIDHDGWRVGQDDLAVLDVPRRDDADAFTRDLARGEGRVVARVAGLRRNPAGVAVEGGPLRQLGCPLGCRDDGDAAPAAERRARVEAVVLTPVAVLVILGGCLAEAVVRPRHPLPRRRR